MVTPEVGAELLRSVKGGPGICCCYLINNMNGNERGCRGTTTGPDDPFCEECSNRHADKAHLVEEGILTITARLPREEKKADG